MLINHWQSIGIDADVAFITQIGYGELALGVLVFLAPVRPLLFWPCFGNCLLSFFMCQRILLPAWGSLIYLNG